MNKGFTLIELLAVIVILAIILVIAVPHILSIINNAKVGAFESDAKMVLSAISYKAFNDETLDLSTINETNIKSLIGIDASNFNTLTVKKINEIIYVSIIGKNKWEGLAATGTNVNMLVYENIKINNGVVLWLDGSDFRNNPVTTIWIDRSGRSNYASCFNFNYTTSSGSDGVGGVKFDAVDDYCKFSNVLAGLKEFTIEIKMKSNSPHGIWSDIISFSNAGSRLEFNSTNNLTWYNNGSGPISNGTTMTSFSNNESFYLTISSSLADGIKTFKNGVGGFVVNNSGIAIESNAESYIGVRGINYANTNATIKMIRIYNRTLTDTEVVQNYNIYK